MSTRNILNVLVVDGEGLVAPLSLPPTDGSKKKERKPKANTTG
jgi:hypothetical protein